MLHTSHKLYNLFAFYITYRNIADVALTVDMTLAVGLRVPAFSLRVPAFSVGVWLAESRFCLDQIHFHVPLHQTW